jgi:hypothetical protein
LHWHKRLNKSQFTSKVPGHNNKLSTKRRGGYQEETEERREEGPNSLMLSLFSSLCMIQAQIRNNYKHPSTPPPALGDLVSERMKERKALLFFSW